MSSDGAFYPVLVTWDEECSGYTPGARWMHGGEYYVATCSAWVPAYIVELGEEEAYLSDLEEEAYLADLEDIAWLAALPDPETARALVTETDSAL